MTALARRPLIGFVALAVIVVLAVIVRLHVYRGLDERVTWSWPEASIARFRLTAVAVAAIVGVALAVSGLLLQALLRNPLASPFILGVSSGAALGVTVAMYVGWRFGMTGLRTGTNAVPALVGAVATLGLVYLLGRRRGWLDPVSLVLVGVVVSAVCSALIMFLHHLVPLGLRGDLLTWMAGAIPQAVSTGALVTGAIVAVGCAAVAFALGRAMDAATLSDDEARSVGLRLRPLRSVLFLAAGALAALAVALAGPIGFVGLIAPHAARILLGPRHRPLVVGAALAGVALLVASDALSQVVSVQGGRMPVGIFTALVGGPSFIWLLRTGRGQA